MHASFLPEKNSAGIPKIWVSEKMRSNQFIRKLTHRNDVGCRPWKTTNTELDDLKLIIWLRKSEATAERISFCIVIEKLMKHGIHCLSCSYLNDVINLLPQHKYDVILISKWRQFCHSAKVLSTTVGYSQIAIATWNSHNGKGWLSQIYKSFSSNRILDIP